jgi:hypothetical protein
MKAFADYLHDARNRFEIKFELRNQPNQGVAADRDPRERGSRPLNTDR